MDTKTIVKIIICCILAGVLLSEACGTVTPPGVGAIALLIYMGSLLPGKVER